MRSALFCLLSVVTASLLVLAFAGAATLQLESPAGKWLVLGPDKPSLSSLAWLERPDSESSSILVLAASHAPLLASLAPPVAVEPGRAWLARVLVKSDLGAAYAVLGVRWLDAKGSVLALHQGPQTFLKHDYAPLTFVKPAPPKAAYAQLVVALQPAGEAVRGRAYFKQPSLQPALALQASPSLPAGLLHPGDRLAYRLEVKGAPKDLKEVQIKGKVEDYEGTQLKALNLTLSLDEGAGSATLQLGEWGPGYYELHLSAEAPGCAPVTIRRSFGCLPPLDFTPPEDYPIACDAGMAWSYPQPEQMKLACYAAKWLGLRQLRDRLWWGSGVNPAPGKFDWGVYAEAAEAEHQAGLVVYQIFHSTPDWTQPEITGGKHDSHYPPRDMRRVYDLAYHLVKDLGDKVRFFELWNEPDISFFAGTVWDYAALVKAGYLGCKDADSTFGVLLGSRCSGAEFWRRALANGVAPYFEIWNQHSYGAPEQLFKLLDDDRGLMKEAGCNYPLWITEMGKANKPDPDGTFAQSERLQVSYLLRAYACGLAAGLDRFHYFYLKNFYESGRSLWGLLREDLSPRPAFLALGALIRQLREAKALGYVKQQDAWCVVFQRAPGELVGVAWSKTPAKVTLSVGRGASVRDAFGRLKRSLSPGRAEITLGPEPVFVRGLEASILQHLDYHTHTLHYQHTQRVPSPAQHVWLQAITRPEQPRPPLKEAYTQKLALHTKAGAKETLALIVHNYSTQPAPVTVQLELPDHWELVDCAALSATVPAGTDRTFTCTFVPRQVLMGKTYTVTARLNLSGAPRDVAKVWYLPLTSDLAPAKRQVLADFDEVSATFKPNHSASLSTTQQVSTKAAHSGKHSLEAVATVKKAGVDCWNFPFLELPQGVDYSDFDGVEVWTYVPPGEESNVNLQLVLVERNGAAYISGALRNTSKAGWERALVPFAGLNWAFWGAPDPDHKLDLDQLASLRIGWGSHTGPVGEKITFYVDDLALVQLKSRP